MLYSFIISDGRLVAPENRIVPNECTVLYEVIRVTNGTILFLDDHIDRLKHSAELAGVCLPVSEYEIRQQLTQLLQSNQVQTGNIKLEFYNEDGIIKHDAMFFIQHRYPSDEAYHTGVRTCLFLAERSNPNAKIIQPELTAQIDQIIAEKKVYEVIMVHPEGYITEGARSNFFMVKDGSVYTAPLADILPGITRKYVLQICHEFSIPFIEKRVSVHQLPEMDACFLSGTSPKVLPIKQIDDLNFDVNNIIVRKIMKRYDELAGLKGT